MAEHGDKKLIMDIWSAYPDTYRVLQLNERPRIKITVPSSFLLHEFIMLNSNQAIKVNGEMHLHIYIYILLYHKNVIKNWLT